MRTPGGGAAWSNKVGSVGVAVKQILSMPLEAGGSVQFEIEDRTATPMVRGGAQPSVIDRTVVSFETALGRVRPVAQAIVNQFAHTVEGATSVKVRFGVKFNAEAGAVIASVGSEANFDIEVEWHRNEAG